MSYVPLGKLEIRNGQTHIDINSDVPSLSPMIESLERRITQASLRDMEMALYGLPVITSKYLPQGTALMVQGKKHDLLIIDDVPQPKEQPVARTTANTEIRVNVYDGPHHGRILLIPANSKVVTLPNPMPAGEMWGPGRSEPSQWTAREYTYSLRQPRNGGQPYLSYVSETRPAFKIPPAPKPVVKLSTTVSDLLQRVTDQAYNVGVGMNGTRTERVRMLHDAERKLAEYISKLEREAYPPVYQARTHTFDA